MNVATTNPSLHVLCNYRPAPVVTPFGRWHQYVLFCTHREQEYRCHWAASDTTRDMGISVTSCVASLYQKGTTQIPIVL